MQISSRVLAVLCLAAPAVAAGATVASGLGSASATAGPTGPTPLARAITALTATAGDQAPIRGVVAEPGRAPVLQRAARGAREAFPVAWVNPLGVQQSVEVVEGWTAPARFDWTRVVLGRRNGRGSLVWRVEGRRGDRAEVWILAPNGSLLSYRRR